MFKKPSDLLFLMILWLTFLGGRGEDSSLCGIAEDTVLHSARSVLVSGHPNGFLSPWESFASFLVA